MIHHPDRRLPGVRIHKTISIMSDAGKNETGNDDECQHWVGM